MKKTILTISAILALTGCSAADIASRNLSNAADNFETNRRIVFYNGITGDYMLTIEGLCSLGNKDPVRTLSVTCKTSPTTFKKHFLGLSDNVTYFVEQLEPSQASVWQYKVVFKPSTILPDIAIRMPESIDKLNAPKITN